MPTCVKTIVLCLSITVALIVTLTLADVFLMEDSSAQSAECYPVQVVPFLQPPYYGTVGCSSVYDHEYPLFGGEAAVPGDTFVITSTVIHYDGVRHWVLSYSGHNGIDYLLRYDPVRAAAPGQVVYAGWNYPGAHATGIGLYVHMRHSNNYDTLYGHMSVLRVRTDDEIQETDEFPRILGLSGNTGESTGPHLHFELEPPGSAASVNPYGWIGGVGNDPWENNPDGFASHDVWLRYPSLTSEDLYPSGDPLSAPPIVTDEEGQFTIDDGSTNFGESPSGCWTVDNTDGWSGDYRHRDIPGNDCTATWTFPYDQPRGRYHVFVHAPNFWDPAWPQGHVIPADRLATVDAAWYEILHTPSASQLWPKQNEIGIVNQLVYPNGYYTSPWIYLGTYYFNSNMQHGADQIVLETETLSATGRLVADAVRFVPLVYRIYLPLVTKRWPPIPDTPVLNPIDNSDHDADYTVSWNPADLADTYVLQESSNSDFIGAVTRYSGAQTALDIYNQEAGTYHYRVKATNSWGDSGWSNVEQATVWPPLTFSSVADVMILSGYPDTNYGDRVYMWAGYDDWLEPKGEIARSLIQFDLSAIPPDTPIHQATLWLYLYSSYDPQETSRTIAAYRATSSWTEGEVTWNTRPSFSGMYGFVSIPNAPGEWYSLDVTDLVCEWVEGQYTNYGMWLLGNESATDPNWRGFSTREGSFDRIPCLDIVYDQVTGSPGVQTDESVLFVSPLPTPTRP